MNRIEAFYDENPQHEWDRLDEHRVEYELTLCALAEYLPPAPAEVIDIGGAAGRYAIELTRRGHAVTLVDLSSKCLDLARGKAAEAGVELADIVHADAVDLHLFGDGRFDAALLMGPLYHLLDGGERLRAVREAWRVLRPGGRVFAAFINRYAVLQFGAAQYVEYVTASRDEVDEILATGRYRRPEGSRGFIDAWFAHPRDVAPLMGEGGFAEITQVACESVVNYLEERINAAAEDVRQRWTDVLYGIAKDPSILGATGHILYVGEKPA